MPQSDKDRQEKSFALDFGLPFEPCGKGYSSGKRGVCLRSTSGSWVLCRAFSLQEGSCDPAEERGASRNLTEGRGRKPVSCNREAKVSREPTTRMSTSVSLSSWGCCLRHGRPRRHSQPPGIGFRGSAA